MGDSVGDICSVRQFIAFLEALHPTSSIYYSLLTSKKGMTFTAYLNFEHWFGGANSEGIATSANYFCISIVFGMNLSLHFLPHKIEGFSGTSISFFTSIIGVNTDPFLVFS